MPPQGVPLPLSSCSLSVSASTAAAREHDHPDGREDIDDTKIKVLVEMRLFTLQRGGAHRALMREKPVHLARRRWQVAGPLWLQTERTRPSLSSVPTAELDPGRDSHQRCRAAATIRSSPASGLSLRPCLMAIVPPKSLFAGQVLEESASAPLGKKLGVLKGEQFLFAHLDEPIVHRDRLRQQDLVSLVVCGSLGRFQRIRRNIFVSANLLARCSCS